MIYQAGINLDIEKRDVQVNFDLDTGLIGFTEKVNGEVKAYHYSGSPVEFKKAFLEKFEHFFSADHHVNFKICRKNPDVMKTAQTLSEHK